MFMEVSDCCNCYSLNLTICYVIVIRSCWVATVSFKHEEEKEKVAMLVVL